MAGALEGFRWALLLELPAPSVVAIAASMMCHVACTVAVLLSGSGSTSAGWNVTLQTGSDTMSDIAIRVEGLGKKFRIGSRAEPYHRLSETIDRCWFVDRYQNCLGALGTPSWTGRTGAIPDGT